MYTAYRTQPIMTQNEKTGEWRFVRWVKLGIVKDMEEAKRLFGGSPVLEAIRT
jgi:hypothetical protein